MKVITSVPFAIIVSIVAMTTASIIAGEAAGTSHEFVGGLALGLSAGGGGCYVGSMARRRHQRRHRR